MPFSPLPKTFLEDNRRLGSGTVVELGCGDGSFARLLRGAGARPWLLDRRHPRTGSAAGIVADAQDPPLPDGCVDLLVAANLLRHLAPPTRRRPVPPAWRALVRPGGCLYIFEDEPCAAPAAARNYRDLQVHLARIAPEWRRPLLAARTFARCCAAERDATGEWSFGRRRNKWPSNPDAVLRFLGGTDAEPDGGEAQRLSEAIAASGLDYGFYWWARWQRREA
jgi:SAM-dependent methyltransferase